MSRTITGTSTIGVRLTLESDNPVTVDASGTIDTVGAYAIDGASPTAWSITNSGLLAGGQNGVALHSGGVVSNAAINASIYGPLYGVDIEGGPGQVTNSGTIASSSKYATGAGVQLLGGGTITNGATDNTAALIEGGQSGAIYINGGNANLVTNSGTIIGLGDPATGVLSFAGGTVLNGAPNNTAALISAPHNGVGIVGGAGTVTNAGTIIGTGATGFHSYGIYFGAGGAVTNISAASIQGSYSAIEIKGGLGSVVNDGAVSGGFGVVLANGGSVANAAAGAISGAGAGAGVAITGGAGTVSNAGAISSTGKYAVTLASGFSNRVIVDPAATFVGTVDGGNADSLSAAYGSLFSTLELASGATQGTIAGLGSQFIDFGRIAVDPGATWSLNGSNGLGFTTVLMNGDLLLPGGASLACFRVVVGADAGSQATISVAGGHLQLNNGGLVVGYASPGNLTILDGGSILGTSVDVGSGPNATGTLDLEGTGSSLEAADLVTIGGSSTGELTQGVSTTVTIHFRLDIGGSGRVGGDGAMTITGLLGNSGTLFAAAGTEALTAEQIIGSGVLEIDAGGNLALNVGTVDPTQTVTFADASAILTIGTLDGFAATIGNFIAGDSIAVQATSIAATTFDASTHALTLFDPSNAVAGSLQFGASVTD